MNYTTIAIDGSAASGKSTLGKTLAQRLNYLYLDTGIMYRAVTWAVLDAGLGVTDEIGVSNLAENIVLEISAPHIEDGRQVTVRVNDKDVTWLIRSPEVDANVSQISSYIKVRRVLTAQQREIAKQGPVVMVGRDIGTVVLPNADLKVFIVASVEERAQRRFKECRQQGIEVDYQTLLESMARRDKLDREKAISPMVPASDAIVIHTDNLTKEEVLQKVEGLLYHEVAA